MEWLLGSGAAAGTVGVVILAIFMAKMAKGNRADLKALAKITSDLSEAKLQINGLENVNAQLEDALVAKENELSRLRSANAVLSNAVGEATKKLADTGNPSGVAADLGRALDRLSKLGGVLQEVPKTGANDSNGGKAP